jgi:hypothetical protein
MDDLISRQAAIDALDAKFNITGRENAETIRDYINGVDKKLRELPSAERHGRWIDVNDDRSAFKCSVCGEISCCNSPFCGECGAQMNGEEK